MCPRLAGTETAGEALSCRERAPGGPGLGVRPHVIEAIRKQSDWVT